MKVKIKQQLVSKWPKLDCNKNLVISFQSKTFKKSKCLRVKITHNPKFKT